MTILKNNKRTRPNLIKKKDNKISEKDYMDNCKMIWSFMITTLKQQEQEEDDNNKKIRNTSYRDFFIINKYNFPLNYMDILSFLIIRSQKNKTEKKSRMSHSNNGTKTRFEKFKLNRKNIGNHIQYINRITDEDDESKISRKKKKTKEALSKLDEYYGRYKLVKIDTTQISSLGFDEIDEYGEIVPPDWFQINTIVILKNLEFISKNSMTFKILEDIIVNKKIRNISIYGKKLYFILYTTKEVHDYFHSKTEGKYIIKL